MNNLSTLLLDRLDSLEDRVPCRDHVVQDDDFHAVSYRSLNYSLCAVRFLFIPDEQRRQNSALAHGELGYGDHQGVRPGSKAADRVDRRRESIDLVEDEPRRQEQCTRAAKGSELQVKIVGASLARGKYVALLAGEERLRSDDFSEFFPWTHRQVSIPLGVVQEHLLVRHFTTRMDATLLEDTFQSPRRRSMKGNSPWWLGEQNLVSHVPEFISKAPNATCRVDVKRKTQGLWHPSLPGTRRISMRRWLFEPTSGSAATECDPLISSPLPPSMAYRIRPLHTSATALLPL